MLRNEISYEDVSLFFDSILWRLWRSIRQTVAEHRLVGLIFFEGKNLFLRYSHKIINKLNNMTQELKMRVVGEFDWTVPFHINFNMEIYLQGLTIILFLTHF